ncbi:putative MFS monocarboxylate transporter [Aspergillus clavatus NRRL 1]|uniref:MFS monocarboxylate transporter, putative n=1 Tax=Aspergillus clavatus (strain ATCC 1007 / CBS 513.65 / DSM 816 / NCTC 3887 / NRRL 1 / QM 1276 / 107) TaxID=344612 RepID=A1C6V4_ASPCL|nr:MFS monocarboxylate transporter, putative [Aspergillus clavatus NRRL 1]EAW14125.1 MFS monocarboxylate transporter, putative [Aspergillus clavatus NRRL 1]
MASVIPNTRDASRISLDAEQPAVPAILEIEEPSNDDIPTKFQSALVVVAAFVTIFTGCGINFAFGVYQELYESMAKLPAPTPFSGVSPAQIDLIGTLAVSMMSLGAPFASGWCKSYSPRQITLAGAVIFALANVLASFSQQLWHFILTQGVLLGCGTCLTYIPAVTVAPGWFTTHRGLAIGIISSGTGVGGVVWAPALRALNARIGFRNTLRLIGALSSILLGGSSLVLDWEPRTKRQNQLDRQASTSSRLKVALVDWRVARTRKFLAQCLSAGFQGAAYYAPVYFMSTYARALGFSAATGAMFISISNASSAIGKIVIGHVADRAGRINVFLFTTLMSAMATLGLWLPSTVLGDKALFIAFAMLYGVFAGAYVSLFPATLVELFGVQHFASVNGFLYMVRGFAALVGTPVAGLLIRGGTDLDLDTRSMSRMYLKTSVLVGVLLVGATVGVAWVRIEAAISAMDGRRRMKWRA